MTITHTVRLDDELDRRFRAEAKRRKVRQLSDLWRELVKGLPPAETKRVTNLDPLPEKVLAKIYARPDRDPDGEARLVKRQAKGVRD